MESLAIFGIACNVIQVISFGHETISTCKRMYREGAADPALQNNTAQMQSVTKRLQKLLDRNSNRHSTLDEEKLIEVAKCCFDTSEKLLDEIKKVTISQLQTKGKLSRAITTSTLATKRAWNHHKIDALEDDLKRYQETLQCHLLLRLCDQNDADNLLQQLNQDNIRGIDHALRTFIGECARGQSNILRIMDEQMDLVSKQHRDTRDYISRKHDRTREEDSRLHDESRDHTSREHEATRDEIRRTQEDVKERQRRLRDDLQLESDGIRDFIRQHTDDFASSDRLLKRREKLIESLDFNLRNARMTDLKEPHSKSYAWLLGDDIEETEHPKTHQPSKSLSDLSDVQAYSKNHEHEEGNDLMFENIVEETRKIAWHTFTDWLKSDEKIYWISGKAGCGKSTLMKFLHSNTRRSLNVLGRKSASNARLLWHFFFIMGSDMQKNIKGLLCNLLYQLLTDDTKGFFVSEMLRRPEIQAKKSVSDWAVKELQDILFEVLDTIPAERPLFMFLDGLDEIHPEEGPHEILDFLTELLQRGPRSLKLCVSSRAERAFQDYFVATPQLKLHHLTAPDIYQCALDLLSGPRTKMRNIKPPNHWPRIFSTTRGNFFKPTEYQVLADRIVEESEGVFLWVHLAIKSLQRASSNMDTLETIEKRLEQLPKKLEELYASMWNRLHEDDKDFYKSEAARYFNLVIQWNDLSSCNKYSVLTTKYTYPDSILASCLGDTYSAGSKGDLEFSSTDLTISHLALAMKVSELRCPNKDVLHQSALDSIWEQCERIYHEIPIRCAGLLEFSSVLPFTIPHASEESQAPNSKIRFIHRTAREFLINTPEGQAILRSDVSSCESRVGAIIRAWITRTEISPLRGKSDENRVTRTQEIESINVIETLKAVQKELSRPTWLKWIEMWEEYLDDIPKSFSQQPLDDDASMDAFDMLGCAALSGITDFVRAAFRRQSALYTREYKSYVLRCVVEGPNSAYSGSQYWGIEALYDWCELLRFLLSEDCVSEVLNFGPNHEGSSACERFCWELFEVLNHEHENVQNDERLRRYLGPILRALIQNQADSHEALYCMFMHGALQKENRLSFFQEIPTCLPSWDKPGFMVLVKWTLRGAINHFAQNMDCSLMKDQLIGLFDGQDLSPPEVLIVCHVDDPFLLKDLWKQARKVPPNFGERISKIITKIVPWDIEDYETKFEEKLMEIDSVVAEFLQDEGPLEDLTEYVWQELKLIHVRPHSLFHALDEYKKDSGIIEDPDMHIPVKFRQDD